MTAFGQTVLSLAMFRPTEPEVPSYGTQLVQTLVALVVVCILAYVILRWGLGRLMGPRTKQGPMEILARMALDGRHGLLVVRVADRVFLLGTGGDSPSLLAELNPDDWAEEAAHWADRKRPSLFEKVLQNAGIAQSTSRATHRRQAGSEAASDRKPTPRADKGESRDGDDAERGEG